MDGSNTQHWAYTRYMGAFQALASAEGRTDITEDGLHQLEVRIHKQNPHELSNAIANMNKRTGWINDIVDRTRQWHEAHSRAVSEFSRFVEVEGRDISFYDEVKHRKFLAKCDNFSLEHGKDVIPHTQTKHKDYAMFRSPAYDAWRSQCRKLSPTRYEDEIRSTDVIPTPERMTTHPKTWRSVAKAIKAHREEPPPWQRSR